MDDHTNASRKFRNCSPRLSETPTEDDEEIIERCKLEARQACDTLIQMGGRPTRPILSNPPPPGKTVAMGGEQWYRYDARDKLFYYGTCKPSGCLHSTEARVIVSHWVADKTRLVEELRRWQDFRDTRQRIRKNHPDKTREEDMERQRYPHDPHLTASLKKLKDWKEYQAYFQRGIDLKKRQIKANRRGVEAIERNNPRMDWTRRGLGKFRGLSQEGWVDDIERRREKLAPEEKRLKWVKQQLLAVLSECAALLMGAPISCRQMEERSELEAKRVYNTLLDTGGRPSRPIQPVPDVRDGEHTDEHLLVLCYWEGEHGQFEEELREWKEFLDHQQKKEADRKAEVQAESPDKLKLREEYRAYKEMELYNAKQWVEFWQRQERQSVESPVQVTLWKEYRSYQQLEVEDAKQWVEFWQRQVKYFQQTEDNYARQGWKDDAQRYHSKGGRMQSHVEDARKQVRPAEMRLQWVEQQLAALLAECAISSAEVLTSDHLEAQAIIPKRTSRSGQNTLKDLRSSLRGNHQQDQNKKHASANSALGPIHSSKVSKAAGRKAPRPGRQSKIPAERGDGQNQGPNTMISPPPPANVAPRRSSRLSSNQKRSDTLEADLAAGLARSAQPRPADVMLRRSDRISKQKERMSTSTSSAAVSSVVILRTAPFLRSKPKGRVAGNKADGSSAKPRGISKTKR